MAPKCIKDIEQYARDWQAKARSGQMTEPDDLGISCGGMSGDYPDIYYDLFPSCEWAENISRAPKSQSLYDHAIEVIIKGLKGLTVYSLSSKDGSGALDYNGCIRSIYDLLKLEDGRAKYIREGSPLEAALCDQFEESLRFVMDKKRRDGYGHVPRYLLGTIGEIAYCSDTYRPRYTQALRERMLTLFGEFYGKMDVSERNALDACLTGPNTYTESYKAFIDSIKPDDGIDPDVQQRLEAHA